MITIKMQDESYNFPDADFSDLEVITACRNIQTISEEYSKNYPDGSDIDAVLDFLQDYGHQLIEQIDSALGEDGACLKMFGNRANIEKLRTAAEQLVYGMEQAWGNTASKNPQAPVYTKHGQKTGKHKNAYQKPQPKMQNDLLQKAKSMSKEEKAALLAALLE